MRRELCELLADADARPGRRAVVLTAIDPVFTAGVDFKDVDRRPDAEPARPRSRSTPAARCGR